MDFCAVQLATVTKDGLPAVNGIVCVVKFLRCDVFGSTGQNSGLPRLSRRSRNGYLQQNDTKVHHGRSF